MQPDETSGEQRSVLSDIKRRLLEQRLRGKAPAGQSGIPRRFPANGPAPLSFAQQRLWFLHQLDPGSPSYNLPKAIRIQGALDPRRLAEALSEIIRRHEILRTTFAEVDGQPAQVIGPALPVPLPEIDLRGLPETERQACLRRLAAEEGSAPFDLARGPLLRARIVTLGGEEHVLLFTLHHIVSDGWSTGVLVRELSALYSAFTTGAPSPLPELPIQYADFATWERQWLRGEALRTRIAYWKEKLAGVPVLDLPTDRPRSATLSSAGARQSFELTPALSESLKALARAEGTTVFTVLIAAYKILLHRYSGQEDLCVGSPAAGRGRVEVEPLIGCFVNTLALRTDLVGTPGFRGVLARVRETVLGAHDHQELPFEKLIEELAPERRLDVTPLFQVMFSLLGSLGEAVEFRGLRLAPIETESRTAKFDLTLAMIERVGRFAGSLEYRTGLFDAATVARMLEHWSILLAGIVADPEARISDLPLLSEEEERQLLGEWSNARRGRPAGALLHELISSRATTMPEALAASCGATAMSYAELEARSSQLAHHLRRLGVGLETRVGICLERTLELVVALLAVLKAGGAYVPLDPGHPAERTAMVLADAGVAVLVSEERWLAELPPGEVLTVCVDRDREVIVAESAAPPRRRADQSDESLAYVIYTSGSTGRPKGVQLSHRAVVNFLLAMAERPGLGAGDVVPALTTITFDIAGLEIYLPLLVGGRVDVVSREEAGDGVRLAARLAAGGATVVQATPATWRLLIDSGWPGDSALRVLCGGEALPRDLAEALLARVGALWNVYGPTETAVWSSAGEVVSEDGPVPLGSPIANTRFYVVDRAFGLAPAGVPGELWIAGDGLARGYLGRPDLTADKFVPDGFAGEAGARAYRTGDLARYRTGGGLEFLGRIDHQVKVRGYRIELGEIEAALGRHPAVAQAVALAREDEAGKRLVAYVVAREGEAPPAAGLRGFLARSLPEYMIPSAFIFLPAFPLTPSGKVDRRALARIEPERDGPARDAPCTVTEELLAGIWSEILGRERVGFEESFFDLGGHSLLATRVMARVAAVFGVGLPLRALFESPTVRGLTRRIEQALGAGEALDLPSIERVPRDGELPLSFAQERLWFLDQLAPGPAYNLPLTVGFESEPQPAALTAALSEVVRRHEALRTVFPASEGRPRQVVLKPGRAALPVVDLSGLPEAPGRREALRLARQEARRPFDLARGPMLRTLLVRIPRQHTLLVTMHHIVTDGWSLQVFRSELSALYAAALRREPSPLPELPVQYADYAVWQRRWLAGPARDAQLFYWRQQLDNLPPPALLPTRQGRRVGRPRRGAGRRLRLSAETSNRLRELCRAAGATPFMALLAGLQALLCRYTGEPDLCVGIPSAGRNRFETERLIGFFLNTLVIRADLSGDPSFAALLSRVREASLGAFAHQDLPFEALLDVLQPERDLGRTPLFQVLFNLLNVGTVHDVADSPRQAPEQLSLRNLSAKFDLTVHARERGPEIDVLLQYDADLFEEIQMVRMTEHLGSLLEGAAGKPGLLLSELPLVSESERGLGWLRSNPFPPDHAWSAALPEGEDASIPERFEAVARLYSDRPAVVEDDRVWTYGRLNRLADQAASDLLGELGEEPHCVALLFDHGAPMIAAILAVLKAGKTYVPLDPFHPEERLSFLCADAGVTAVLADAANAALAERLAAGRFPARVLAEEVSGPFPARLPKVPGESIAYLLYTSGSTGEPKGVAQSHRNVLGHLRAYTDALRISPEDRLSLLATYAFDAAVMDIFGALLNGASLYPFGVRRRGLAPLPEWLASSGITVYHSTPTLFRSLLDGLDSERFPAVRLVVLGGEKCLRQDIELFRRHFPPESLFVNGLGPTESTLALQFFASAETVLSRETMPVGWPVAGTGVRIRNRTGDQVAAYGVGEIVLRSSRLALGYWGRPDLTAAAFQPDTEGWGERVYATGDLGRWLPDGSLEFVGRNDSQVKIRGHRVEIGEVENRLNALPGVRQAVVTAREDEAGDLRLIAYLLAAGAALPSNRELRTSLKDHLPDFMIPARFVRVEEWPLTSTGKVDRAALPVPASGLDEAPGEASREPETPVEELLCALWADLLKVPRVRAGDDFFALGGHSLLATRLVSRVLDVLGVEVPLIAVFEAPTVAEFARRVEAALWEGRVPAAPPILPLSRERYGGDLPPSSSQRRLWFLDRLQPGSSAYNMASALGLEGPLDSRALAAALDEVTRRHQVLRTSFAEVAGEPVQRIEDAGPVPLPVIALDGLPPGLRHSEARRLTREEAGRPFDLARGPLLRARLLRVGEKEHSLLLTLHHIIADGWSQVLLRQEISLLYAAFSRGEPSPLPEPTVQYADFACWEREWLLRDDAMEAQLSYWREQLRGAPERLALPLDRPRPPLPSFRGSAYRLVLPSGLAVRLGELGRSHGDTLFMVLLTGFEALLARLTGEEDLCVGTPVAGRTRPEVEGLLGMFARTLVLRGDLSGDPTFRELLSRTRTVALQAHSHQDLPFEKLVEELQPARSLDVSPLFQVMFTLQNARRDSLTFPGLKIRSSGSASGSTKFDLSLTIAEGAGGLGVMFEYACELFDRTSVARWADSFATLLEAVAANPELRVGSLPLLRPEERHQLLREWNDTQEIDARDGLCLHRLVEAWMERRPEAVAAVFGGERLTYGQLDEESGRLAGRLRAAGIGRGSCVPVLIDSGLDLVIGLLAILRAGAAFAPLDVEWPAARLEAVLSEISAAGGGSMALVGEQPPFPPPPGWCWLRGGSDTGAVSASPPLPSAPADDPEQPVYVMYTSGSTGRPKGVVIPHRGIVNRFLWMDRFFGAPAAMVVLQTTRYVFDSVVWQIFWPMIHGGATVLTAPGQAASPADLADLVERHGVTLADFVPSIFGHFVEQLRGGAEPVECFASLRAVVVGGEELAPQTALAFRRLLPEVMLVNLYGPTEASIGCIYHPVTGEEEGRVPIGRPISNVQPLVLDRWGNLAPIGVAGELGLAGRCLGLGYWRDEERTRLAFVPHPCPETGLATMYRTGDLARRRPDGTFDFLGRIDHQVKIRGLRIELGEIETTLREHPEVLAALVLVWPEGAESRDRQLVAFFVPRHGGAAREEDLRAHLRSRLPSYMVPSLVVALDALPLTPNGKVDRKALGQLASEASRSRPEGEEETGGRTPFEDLLAGIWSEVLRLERVGPADDFFHLGGHSLLATQVVSRLRKTFAVELPLRALFEEPTLAGLARRVEAVIRRGGSAAAPPIVPVPRDRDLPLSFAQQRLWFLDRLTPGAGVYKLFNALQLEGPLEVAALARSLGEVVRRHESLRTSFPSVDGAPVQRIAAQDSVGLPVVDLSGLPRELRLAELSVRTRSEASRPFDLEMGPLMRAVLLSSGAEEHTLLIAVHHAVCDGWSTGILLRELWTGYRAFSRGESPGLPPPPVQYADYAVWQRSWMQGEILDQEVAYWRGQLAGMPEVLELPADRPRPSVQTFRGGRLPFVLPGTLTGSLSAFGRQAGSTLFMTLLAGLDTLLHRYTGEEGIPVGTPIANRTFAELEGVIGNFANTLVLGVNVGGNPSFRDLVGRVRETALGAYGHQDLPFESLVEALSPRRDLSYNPLFQVLFGLHNLPRSKSHSSGLGVRQLGRKGTVARFDLALDLAESPEGVGGAFEYASDLFDAPTVARLSGHLQGLLAAAMAAPDRRLSELALLSEPERHQLLAEWNDSSVDAALAGCLHERFELWAARRPEAVAVVCGAERVSYGELDRRAERLARRLRTLGVGPETPVGVCLERSVEMLVALLGVLKAGGAYVPLDPAYPRQRVAWILESAGVPVVVTRGVLLGGLPAPQWRVVDLDEPSPEPLNEADRLASAVTADHTAYVIFTSGSTGRPKGVQVAHGSAVHLLDTARVRFGFGEEDVWTVVHSYAFDFSVWEIWGALTLGGRLVVVPLEVAQSPMELAQLLQSESVTVLNQTPSAIRQLADAFEGDGVPPSLRLVVCGGEAFPRDLAPRLVSWGVPVWNFYGPTEATVWAAAGLVTDTMAGEGAVPLGPPLPDVRLLVLGPASEPLPVGVPGELCIAGAGLARGYFREPELTAAAFVPNAFAAGERLYRTGDRVRRLPDGSLEFLGRIDQQVKVRGFRIEPGEIEAALAQHPSIRQVVVLAAETAPGDHGLVAYMVVAGDFPSTEALRQLVLASLPSYMVPSLFVSLDALPLTPNGKVDRKALGRLASEGARLRPEGEAGVRGPRDELELRLVRLWESLLAVRPIGITDNFFDLGGHSMLAVRLLSGVRRELGQDIPVSCLFQSPTIDKLATVLRRKTGPANHPVLVKIQQGSGRQPFFCVHPVGGNVLCYHELARQIGTDRPFFGLQTPRENGTGSPERIEEMASLYLDAVRGAQPAGPYLLGGWSLGGMVAFEMARQLASMGEEVGLLAVIDEVAPANGHSGRKAKPKSLVFDFARHLAGPFARNLRIASDGAGAPSEDELLRRVLVEAQREGVLPADLDMPEMLQLFRIFKANYEARRSYKPGSYAGSVTLFLARDTLAKTGGEHRWNSLAAGGVDLHVLPGDHFSLMRRPDVESLGKRLRTCLSRIDGTEPQ